MSSIRRTFSRRQFLAGSALSAAGAASLEESPGPAGSICPVLDVHMHFEAYGEYWENLIDEIIEHYDYAGVDRGVVFTCWTPTRESNDRTLAGCRRHPGRFIPFSHVRTVDPEWREELERTGDLGWQGIKLHQNEIARGPELKDKTREVVETALRYGIRIILIHLEDYGIMEELTRQLGEAVWIIPHMGYDHEPGQKESFCRLARERENVYLDTSGSTSYYRYGPGIEWAGVEKVLFGSDGFWCNPSVERAKIDSLRLPTPFRTPRLSQEQVALILGGNLARLLKT